MRTLIGLFKSAGGVRFTGDFIDEFFYSIKERA